MAADRVNLTCNGCGTTLEFGLEHAGQSGPCYQCGAVVRVPHALIVCVCGACQTQSEFTSEMIGQSGPCRACGAVMTVNAPAPGTAPVTASRPPANGPSGGSSGPSGTAGMAGTSSTNPFPEVAPSKAHLTVAKKVEKEGQKAQINVGRGRVVRLGEAVSGGEVVGAALKARFSPFGAKVRTDRAMAIPLERAGQRAMIVFPFSGNRVLAHEFASLVPGSLPTNLWLVRSAMGSWGDGRYTTPEGDDHPVALACNKARALGEGIEWNVEQGNSVIKLKWGMQLIARRPGQSLHVMQTAEQGIIFKDKGLLWYFERQAAMNQFLAESAFGQSVQPPQHYVPVLSDIFLDLLG